MRERDRDAAGSGAPAEGGGLAERLAALGGAHMRPLEALREAIERRHGPTPHADPHDGGTGAEVLILLETPGPGAHAVPFISRDHPSGTMRNLTRFAAAAGLRRERTVIWNVVPWIVHAPGAPNRALRRGEVAAGLAELPAFLALLPGLRAAVLSGRVAREARGVIEAARPEVALFTMPHPSPTYVCTKPEIAPGIVEVLKKAAEA